MRDIVYILRKDINPEELRYSLRSVEKNFRFSKLWFVCGQPKGFYPDGKIDHIQVGMNKWQRVRSSLMEIIKNDEISEEFYLFNDDFFVLKRQSGKFMNFSNGTLQKRIRDIEIRTGSSSNYTRELLRLMATLQLKKLDTMSFAVHMPMLLTKTLVRETLKNMATDGTPMFRSYYGNEHEIPYIYHKDVKIYERSGVPGKDWDYCSTTEDSFRNGEVGEYIRKLFDKPSRFESAPATEIRELYTEEGDLI